MTRYTVLVCDRDGKPIAQLDPVGTMSAARQAMLDHAGVFSLPDEEPWHGPGVGVLEGWFIGRTEYLIGYADHAVAASIQPKSVVA